MDRAPAAVAPSQHRQSIADMETILRDRDEDIRYSLDHSADDTRPRGLTEVRVSCGCEGWPLKACPWHVHVAEALADAQDIVTYFNTMWVAIRKGFDPGDPQGSGYSEDAAVAELREKEAWLEDDREAGRSA